MQFPRNKPVALASLVIYWLLTSFLTFHTPIEIFKAPDALRIIKAKSLASTVSNPFQLPESGWADTDLPNDWYHADQMEVQYWYRVYFPSKLAESNQNKEKIWQLYLPSVSHNAEVFINGVWIGRGGKFSDPVSRHHNKPLLFNFDSSVLNLSNNIAEIRVKASHPSQGYLGKVYVGPSTEIEPSYRWKQFVRVDFIYWITVGMLFLSFVVFLFWVARPSDRIYLVFSMQLLVWSIHNFNLFTSNIPTSTLFWEALTMATLGWTVVLMIIFNHRFLNVHLPWVDRISVFIAVLGFGIFFLPEVGLVLKWGYSLWDSFLIVLGSYSIVLLTYIYLKKDNNDALLMLIAGVPILTFGLHDILLVNHHIERSEGLIIQYSAIPAIILFTWFLVRRFVNSLNLAEELTANLELRVKNREEQLEEQFARTKALEKESVLAGERERIMRDMHDGIGGHLISLSTQLQDTNQPEMNAIKEKVDACITDLRMVIDSLDPMLNDLATLLGMMRFRLEPMLNSADIKLRWEVENLDSQFSASPTRNLHIMRIVQEAITNAVKHSNTKDLLIKTGKVNKTKVFILIQDYGTGLTSAPNMSSRGLSNMQYRAEQICATLHIHTDNQGVGIEIVFN